MWCPHVVLSSTFGALVESTDLLQSSSVRQRRRMRRQPATGSGADQDAEVGTFWHVTDWHLNEFQPDNPDACDMCRSRASAASRATCKQPPVGRYGHTECDPAPSFWREAIRQMQLKLGSWCSLVHRQMKMAWFTMQPLWIGKATNAAALCALGSIGAASALHNRISISADNNSS